MTLSDCFQRRYVDLDFRKRIEAAIAQAGANLIVNRPVVETDVYKARRKWARVAVEDAAGMTDRMLWLLVYQLSDNPTDPQILAAVTANIDNFPVA